MKRLRLLLLLPFLFAVAMVASAAAATPVAVLGFEFVDRSLEGELRGQREDETRRIRMLSQQLQNALAESPLFAPVTTTPADSQKIAAMRPFLTCNGCDADIARALGARWAVFGVVEKISNLILDIRVVVRDADSGKALFAERVGIRGNTDRSWQNGLRWLLEERLLAAGTNR